MPVKALSSPSKSRLFRVFAPTTTKRTKLAACLVLVAVLTLLLHPSMRRVVHSDLASPSDAQPSSVRGDTDAATNPDDADVVPRRRGTRRHGVDDDAADTDSEHDDAADDDKDAHDEHDKQINEAAAAKWGVPGEDPVVLPGAPDNDLKNSGMKLDHPDEATVRAPVDAGDVSGDTDTAAGADGDDDSDVGTSGKTATIVTCPGCRLNALPEVKKFVHELAKVFEPGLKIDFKIGEDPVLHLYDAGKKTEAIALDKFTSDQIIQRLVKHGIFPSTEIAEVNRVVDAIEKKEE